MIADDPKQWTGHQAWVSFNVNDRVRVRLTNIGLAEFSRIRCELNATLSPTARPFPTEPTLDADGYYSDSMWSLMNDFGHLMMLGRLPPFETEMMLRYTVAVRRNRSTG